MAIKALYLTDREIDSNYRGAGQIILKDFEITKNAEEKKRLFETMTTIADTAMAKKDYFYASECLQWQFANAPKNTDKSQFVMSMDSIIDAEIAQQDFHRAAKDMIWQKQAARYIWKDTEAAKRHAKFRKERTEFVKKNNEQATFPATKKLLDQLISTPKRKTSLPKADLTAPRTEIMPEPDQKDNSSIVPPEQDMTVMAMFKDSLPSNAEGTPVWDPDFGQYVLKK